MEYNIIQFDDRPEEGEVKVEDLKKFLEDAEIIITNYGEAYSKDIIKEAGDGLRGAVMRFNNGEYVQGYDIVSKLVKSKRQ